MGLTIHYDISFKGTAKELKKALNSLGNIAKELGFAEVQKDVHVINFRDSDPHTDSDYLQAKDQLEFYLRFFDKAKDIKKCNGITKHIWFGEGCESTCFDLIREGTKREWTGKGFTKTHYAENFTKAHISVCALLRAAEKLGFGCKVSDEGDFYETNDLTRLLDNLQANYAAIATFLKIFVGDNNPAKDELKKMSLE